MEFALVLKESYRQQRKRLGIRKSSPRCCPNCGKQLSNRQLFNCSISCGKIIDSKWMSEISKKPRKKFRCHYCKKAFFKLPSSRINAVIRKQCGVDDLRVFHFCSSDCREVYYGEHGRVRGRSGRVIGCHAFVFCRRWDKPVLRSKALIKRSSKHFCSHDCRNVWMSSEENMGENHPCFNPNKRKRKVAYCDIWSDLDYKIDLYIRDDFRCMNPSCWNTSNRLCLHHIDNDKKNCHPWNLITLCNSCNTRAAGGEENRLKWQRFYEGLMAKLYFDLYPKLACAK